MVKEQPEAHPTAPQRGDVGQTEAAPALDPASAGESSNRPLNGIVCRTFPRWLRREIKPEGDGPVKSAELRRSRGCFLA